MVRSVQLGIFAFVGLVCLPIAAFAQSQFTGQVRDESGAILPGVTVEAASPVLIEKTKSAVTDDQGRYTIVDLRPGIYTVTFTLTGFTTVAREGVELPSNFVATINADMAIGGLEESVLVTSEAPAVDTSRTTIGTTASLDSIQRLPLGRNFASIASTVAFFAASCFSSSGF